MKQHERVFDKLDFGLKSQRINKDLPTIPVEWQVSVEKAVQITQTGLESHENDEPGLKSREKLDFRLKKPSNWEISA